MKMWFYTECFSILHNHYRDLRLVTLMYTHEKELWLLGFKQRDHLTGPTTIIHLYCSARSAMAQWPRSRLGESMPAWHRAAARHRQSCIQRNHCVPSSSMLYLTERLSSPWTRTSATVEELHTKKGFREPHRQSRSDLGSGSGRRLLSQTWIS